MIEPWAYWLVGFFMYGLMSLFVAVLPVQISGRLRALAMVLWPVTLVVAFCYLPVLVWSAAEEDYQRKKRAQGR